MGHSRPRYNQKGRAASLEQEKERSRKRRKLNADEGEEEVGRVGGRGEDGELEMIDPKERKKKREEMLAARRAAAAEPAMSNKKKKKLESYIDRKLKKESRVALIASLAETQTQNLDLRSSSSLGSKQFTSQRDRLQYNQTVEESRRGRARGILEKVKGKGGKYLSEDEDDSEESGEESMEEKEEGPIASTSKLAPTLSASKKKSEPFNLSGSLGVVEVPRSSSSSSNSIRPSRPSPVPATVPATISPTPTLTSPTILPTTTIDPTLIPKQNLELKLGSGLKEGTVIKVVNVKRREKEKGKWSRFKRVIEEVEESGGSESDEDEEEDDEEDDESDEGEEEDMEGSEGSWGGIESGGESEEEEDEDEDDGESSESDSDVDQPPAPKRLKGSFQSWADTALLTASGHLPPSSIPPAAPDTSHPSDPYVPLLPSGSGAPSAPLPEGLTGPLGTHLPASSLPTLPPQRTTVVHFARSEEIQKSREALPILGEEEEVMRVVKGNSVVLLCGETGSGKTTQIGQFLLEAGWGDKSGDNPGMIAITQPRRVAALSTSSRVRTELSLPSSSPLVSHQIRYSSTTTKGTKLVFMTDGVLLRELAEDFLLKKWSLVVVDEAHERGVNTDVLVGVLSRVVRVREEMWRKGEKGAFPLRLIIMSATLRVTDFSSNPQLFPIPPPIISITTRQHPVTIHFSRRTSPDYMEEAYKKVARIHARLPPGGVLVFCTGQNEIVALCKRLEKKFGRGAVEERKRKIREAKEGTRSGINGKGKERAEEEDEVERDWAGVGDGVEVEDIELGVKDDHDLAADVDDGIPEEDEEGLDSDSEDEDSKIPGLDLEADTDEPMHILPLYSLLPTEKQMKVFQEPPAGTRLVVVATNVAETSITIPNIKYVVDCGRAKERRFNPDSGIQSFEVNWISKASASQRSGRAGRTGPGHCYRLYSSSVFTNYFDSHTSPEILRMPIEGIVLQMKSMNIDSVANFPFPTPPDREALRRAEMTLVRLGALEGSESISRVGGKITELGRAMALFPLNPRFSKMIVTGQQHDCLPYVIAIVCALSVGDPFIREQNLGDEESGDGVEGDGERQERIMSAAEIRHIRDPELRAKEELKVVRKSFFEVQKKYAALGKGTSDAFKFLSVVGAYEYEGGKDSFCSANFVRPKAMEEIHKLRAQISKIVQATYPGIDAGFVPKLQPPSDTQVKVLRQLLTSAFIDQVCIRKDLIDKSSNLSYAKVESTRGVPYRSLSTLVDEDLFVHPSSGMFHDKPPEYLVYGEMVRTSKVWLKSEPSSVIVFSPSSAHSIHLTAITKINPSWLPILGRPLCTFSKPFDIPVSIKEKSEDPNVRKIFVTPRFGAGIGVELKTVMMEQKLVGGRWVLS